jgi:CHAD domain-containing protein
VKKLEKYLEKQLRSLEYLLRKPADSYSTITFHRLRVRVKKLHSLLKLLNYCFEDFKLKSKSKSFDKIFQQAGKIREFQIEETRLKYHLSNNTLPVYKSSLKENEIKAKKIFFLTLKNINLAFLKNAQQHLIPFIKKVKTRRVKKYIKENLEEMQKIVSHGLSTNKKIHHFRKQLKNIQYVLKSTDIESESKLIENSTMLSDLLGKWHDCRVIIKHLEKINGKKMKTPEKKLVEKIRLGFVSKNALLLTKIISKL